jgi:lipoyl synthase
MEDLFTRSPKKKLNVLPNNPENTEKNSSCKTGRFPSWLHRKIPKGKNQFKTNEILEKYNLNTVCEEAKCPNKMECFAKRTATFLALGKQCTRACGFCDIDFSKTPIEPEADEPYRIACSVKDLNLAHVVITMVARDDLQDFGASHIAKIIDEIRALNQHVTIEVLTSDFAGNENSLNIVLNRKPEIFNHNIETVRELTPKVRHTATYERTLLILKKAKQSQKCKYIKSGIMVGLGETTKQVFTTIKDLKDHGCDIITIGQYLQASRLKLRVKDFITPDIFKEYENFGKSIGIKNMYCGPFVRSSYNAADFINNS